MEVVSYGSESETKPPIFFLHGFPGIRSRQNREIAESVAKQTGAMVYLFLYSGLGQAPGTFSFERCVDDVRDRFEEFFEANPTRKIDLVGHSWGGFLSLLIASEFPSRIRRLALMSPLLEFFDETTIGAGLKEYSIQYPFLDMEEPRELAREFVRTGKNHPTESLVQGLSDSIDVLFLQAKDDNITPRSVAEARLPLFQRPPEYRIANNDHSFLMNRDQLSKEIAEFFMR